jgi:hypothetical protein
MLWLCIDIPGINFSNGDLAEAQAGSNRGLPHVSPTLSEITHKTAIEWKRQRFRRNKNLQNFFNLRRNWSK